MLNKVVILTGASAGIGAATARALAASGAQLVLAARDIERLTALQATLPGQHCVVACDIAEPAAAETLVRAAITAFGRIDVVICNAGIGLAAPVAQLAIPDLERVLAVNVSGPVRLVQAALPHLHGHGQIMLISSVVGLRSLPYTGGYAASKAALDRLSEALRVELRGTGVAVTLVRPGTTRTEFHLHRLGSSNEIRRSAPPGVSPERVASAIVRAVTTRPRVVYVTVFDRILTWVGLLIPRLSDAILARAIRWARE